jgi:hypothetical protein
MIHVFAVVTKNISSVAANNTTYKIEQTPAKVLSLLSVLRLKRFSVPNYKM